MNRRDLLSATLRGAAGLLLADTLSKSWAQSLLSRDPEWIGLNGSPAGWATVRGGEASLSRQPVDRGPGGILPPPSAPLALLSDLQLQFGCGMSSSFYRWIGTCLQQGQPAPACLEVDHAGNHDTELRRHWSGAYVTRFAIPSLDADSKEPAQLQVLVHPSRFDSKVPSENPSPSQSLCAWPRSGFRFYLSDLSRQARRIQGIASIVCTRPLATNVLDANRRNSIRAGAPVFSSIGLRLSAQEREKLVRQFGKRQNGFRGFLVLSSEAGKPWLKLDLSGLRLLAKMSNPEDSDLQLSIASAYLRPLG